MNTRTLPHTSSPFGWQIGISALALIVTSLLVQLYRVSQWVENWQVSTTSMDVAVTPLLLVPLSIVWTALVVGVLGLFLRQRATLAILALVPWLWYVGQTLVSDDGAKPAEHFQHTFGIELPISASNLRARLPTLADRGNAAYAFRCTPNDTADLIDALELQPWPHTPDTDPPHLFSVSAPHENAPEEHLQFWLRQDPTGLGVILATNSARTLILLAREPILGKEE